MDAKAAVTLVEGREVPEQEVLRSAGETPAPTQSFQARAAETVIQGSRRRRGAQAGETPTLPPRSFEVREAGTVTLRPPHWEGLVEVPPAPAAGPEIAPEGIPSAAGFGTPAITQTPPPEQTAGEDARPYGKEEN